MSHYPEYKLPRARMSSTLITDYRHDEAVEEFELIFGDMWFVPVDRLAEVEACSRTTIIRKYPVEKRVGGLRVRRADVIAKLRR